MLRPSQKRFRSTYTYGQLSGAYGRLEVIVNLLEVAGSLFRETRVLRLYHGITHMGSSWDPEITSSCQDFLNKRLSTRPSCGGWGGGALTISRCSSLSLWVARPGASCSSVHRPLMGARTGRAACPSPAPRHRF